MTLGTPTQRFFCWKCCCVLVFMFLLQHQVQAAHSRRHIVSSQKNNGNNKHYDRSITSFDPAGRLLQVEYSMEATKRGENIMAFLTHDGSILVLVAQPGACSRAAKVHRIDDSIWLFTAGLTGDARALATHLRAHAKQHRLSYGEPMTVKEAATQSAAVQHELTRTGGARPLGCTAIILGMDPGGARLFRTDPGGGLEDCYFCCAGRDQDRLLSILMEKYDKIRVRSVSDVIRKLVGYMRQHGQDKSKASNLEVWLLRPHGSGKTDVTCFTEIGSSDSLKTIASYMESQQSTYST